MRAVVAIARARHAARIAGLALIVALVAACARTPRPVSLTGAWPAQGGDYKRVTRAWTRAASIRAEYQLVAKIHATLKSPEWRAAWLARRVRTGSLGAQAQADLERREHDADAAAVEVEIILVTWDRRENDLERGDRSVWRLWLVDADGNEIPPIEVKRDKRPENIIRSEFPSFGDFSQAYVARFPRTDRIFGPGVDSVALRLSSTRGGVQLIWHAP
ncbi:MAG: hypothetical protein H6709_14680 [Kofleriaceae bacterium]|nr:hypothetical protein [Kofleriaceae bacterium]MCB9573324.1 hypothetical protein [Kofleriaceae bacterium]